MFGQMMTMVATPLPRPPRFCWRHSRWAIRFWLKNSATGLGANQRACFFGGFSPRWAITFCKSFQTSPFAAGLRNR